MSLHNTIIALAILFLLWLLLTSCAPTASPSDFHAALCADPRGTLADGTCP